MKIEGRDTSPIVGIDLGTTNSLVAIVQGGVPTVLNARDGGHLVPSVVSFAADVASETGAGAGAPARHTHKPLVGRAAKRAKVTDARHTAFSVKRLLGRSFGDVDPASFPYELVPSSDGVIRVRMGERSYTAIEISAMILRELKLAAEKSLAGPVTRAVITVPAYFNDSQRQATRAAGRLAGLDVLRIVNEPTAAALAYGLDRKKQGLIAVYDLGGGTFDVSILRLHDGIFEVLATSGDTELGGDDLDRVLVEVCAEELRERFGEDPATDRELLASLLEGAEKAKIAFSTADSAEIEVSLRETALRGTERLAGAVGTEGGSRVYRRGFIRAEFEALVKPLLERTREPCLRALADAGLKREELSDVILVGGPTRLSIVQSVARDIFGREPNTSVHPDEVVATGAAIQADILAGNTKELLLLDVVPLSLGIETYGGVMSTLIPRNTKIPAVARETFTTFVDHQTGVDVHVLQGERERVEDNRSLARFKLMGIEPMPAGLPRVEVTFLIDADGILQVAAKDLRTGNEQAIEVRPSFGLSEQEIDRMLRAQADHAEDDVRHRELVEARNSAEPVLRATEKALPDARRLLPAPELEAVLADLDLLRTAMNGKDPDQVRAASHRLSGSTSRLADLIVAETIRAQAAKNAR